MRNAEGISTSDTYATASILTHLVCHSSNLQWMRLLQGTPRPITPSSRLSLSTVWTSGLVPTRHQNKLKRDLPTLAGLGAVANRNQARVV